MKRGEVGDEGACARAARDALQHGGLHLGGADGVELAVDGVDNHGPLHEGLLDALVDYEVHIALAIAQLGIVEAVVSLAVLHLDNGQGLEALGEQLELLGVDRDLARLRAEHISLHAHEVADVQQALEHDIIHVLVLARADAVAHDIYLNTSLAVLQLKETGLAHNAAAHHSSGDADSTRLGRILVKLVLNIYRKGVGGICLCGIRVDAHFPQLRETLATVNLLFAQIEYVHNAASINSDAKLLIISDIGAQKALHPALPRHYRPGLKHRQRDRTNIYMPAANITAKAYSVAINGQL